MDETPDEKRIRLAEYYVDRIQKVRCSIMRGGKIEPFTLNFVNKNKNKYVSKLKEMPMMTQTLANWLLIGCNKKWCVFT